ncbi:MAG: hypothetical protein MUC75_05500, partial [Ignavibacteriaceae bacterium]|nr:hypothetical protein [Ignavibacteriaceae bacterium]
FSTDKNPQNIVYNMPGIYNVTLTATNSLGSDTLMKSCYIEVLEAVFVNDDVVSPEEFILYQNYPNPFNPATSISWNSPISGWQTLKVYDVLGNEVATLVNEEKPAGSSSCQQQTKSSTLRTGRLENLQKLRR